MPRITGCRKTSSEPKCVIQDMGRQNRGNRDPLMVLEESRYVCRYVLTFFGDWLVHASDVMVAMDENMYD